MAFRFNIIEEISCMNTKSHINFPSPPPPPPPPTSELTQASRSVGEDALQYLSILKQEKPGSGTIAAGANSLQKTIRTVERLAGVSVT